MRTIKKTLKMGALVVIPITPLITMSCGTQKTHVAPKTETIHKKKDPIHRKKEPIHKKKEIETQLPKRSGNTYFEKRNIPSTLLNALNFDVKNYNKIKRDEMKRVKLTETKDNYIVTNDSDTFKFPKNIFASSKVLKNKNDLIQLVREYTFTANIPASSKMTFNFLVKGNGSTAGTFDKEHNVITIFVNTPMESHIFTKQGYTSTLLHERMHSIYFNASINSIDSFSDDIIKKDSGFRKMWDETKPWEKRKTVISDEVLNSYYKFPIKDISPRASGWVENTSAKNARNSGSGTYTDELVAELSEQLTQLQTLPLYYKGFNKDYIERHMTTLRRLPSSSLASQVGYKLYDKDNFNKPLNIMKNLLKYFFNVNQKENTLISQAWNDSTSPKDSNIRFESYGTKYTNNLDKLVVSWPGGKKEINIKHKKSAFGFHGRPWDSEDDFKYVTDTAYIQPTDLGKTIYKVKRDEIKVELFLKDGSKVPEQNMATNFKRISYGKI